MQTRSVVFTGPGVAEVVEETLREPAEDEVLIRNELTLISPGTERAFLLGLPNASHFPYHAGYSNVGTVVAAGSAAGHLPPGTRVVGQGRHSDHCILRASTAFPVPADLAPEHAVFTRLAAIALQGVRKARIELGESVLVVGLGLIGLLAAQLAGCAGGLPVVAVESDAFRRGVAERCGLAHCVAPPEAGALPGLDWLPTARRKGFDVVIEATGYPEAIGQSLAAAGQRGRVVLLGSTRGLSTVNFYEAVHSKGALVIGAHNNNRPNVDDSPGYWTTARDSDCVLRLLSARRLRVDPCVTHRVTPDRLLDVYRALGQWEPTLLAAIIRWSGGA